MWYCRRMKKKLAGFGLLLSFALGLYSASMRIGEPARLVDVLTLFFTGAGAGASLTAYLRRACVGERKELRRDEVLVAEGREAG